jgi:Dolichyl-phosphate-mannose-protein mannosyltransferase
LEVQGRPALAPRRLSPALAWLWARRWAALALVTVVTVAATIVDAQPVRSPWWTYADADASYTASGLNLLLGEPVRFVDHPGLPVTEAASLAFGVDALLDKASLSWDERLAYVDERLLDLDRSRGIFRGIAIAFYLAGALLSFLLIARLFGHWTWGFAAGLLWLAAPGLVPMSIQLRPDVLLAVLTLVFAYFVGRAVESRAASTYAWAAAVAGLAFMVKLHAAGLLVPLGIALAWRPPLPALPRPDRRLLIAVGLAVAVPALLLNWTRAPFDLTQAQTQALVGVLAVGAACGAVIRFVPRLAAYGVVAAGYLAGLVLPIALDVPDGLQALVQAAKTATGTGVQSGVESFSTPFSQIDDIVGARVMVVFMLAAAAGVYGLVRRQPQPVVWAAGGLAMAILAFARPPNVHYFAPAFVFSALCLLWLVHRSRPGAAPLLIWPVVLLLAWPAFDQREAPAAEANRFAGVVASSQAVVDSRLQPGEVAFVPSYWPFADARYYELVQIYVDHVPPYPYRYLPAIAGARDFAAIRGWTPRYYVGPQAASVAADASIPLGDAGTYPVRRIPETDLALEILGPPQG